MTVALHKWVDQYILAELGGEGSGNFDHKGRPGMIGGSASSGMAPPQVVGGTMFHGTPSEFVMKILKEGLKPQANPRKDGSGKETRNPSVYMSTDYDQALAYGEADGTGNFGMVKFSVPQAYQNKVMIDEYDAEEYGIETNYRIEETVRPEWISRVELYKEFKLHKVLTLQDGKIVDTMTMALEQLDISTNFYSTYILSGVSSLSGKPKFIIKLGGEGSGNFDHAGRPGLVGGSAPDGPDTGDPAQDVSIRKFNPGDRASMNADLADEFDDWYPKLSDGQQDTIENYTGGGFNPINRWLRNPGEYEDQMYGAFEDEGSGDISAAMDAEIEELEEEVGLIDKALEKSPGFDVDTIVYRGIDYDPELVEGDQVSDDGFVSTSLDRDTAAQFTPRYTEYPGRNEEETNHLFEIIWPKGKIAGYVPPLSQHPTEQEVILPRSVSFKVEAVRNEMVDFKGKQLPFKIYTLSYVEFYGS